MNATRVSKRLMMVAMVLCSACSAQQVSRIYVLSANRGCRITTYTLQGKQVDPDIPIGGFDCNGMVIDAAGNLLVSTMGRGVTSFAQDGSKALLIGAAGARALALDGTGRIHLLVARDPDNWLVRRYRADGPPISGQLQVSMNNASGIAVDGTGKTFIVSQGNEMVKMLALNGLLLVQTIKTGSTPRALAVGSDGKIYVANFLSVATFMPDGNLAHPVLKHRNPATLGVDTPTALTVDKGNGVYVGYDNGYVGILDRDGKPKGDAFMTREDIRGIAVK